MSFLMASSKCDIVTKSLLRNSADLPSDELRKFCLGLTDWCPCCIKGMAEKENCNDAPAPCVPQTRSKSLSLKRPKTNPVHTTLKKTKEFDERFSFDVTTDDLTAFQKGECPANTAKSTDWVFRNFELWRTARNERYSTEQCPANILQFTDRGKLCEWLCKFISETRKSDGAEYTPRSLYLLLSEIQRKIRSYHPEEEINIFQEPIFKPLKNVCNSVFKRLHAKGIGTEMKATPALSDIEEAKFWDTGVIGTADPTALLHAVFFYNGKNFCLRGGVEHRKLKISQLKRDKSVISGKEVNEYVYTEYGSKNNQGGFSSLNLSNKIVHQYEVDSERCHVKILDLYLQKLPSDAKEKDVFYLRPLPTVPSDPSQPWFTSTPVGKNTLNNMMKQMCQNAGISQQFTNHSLRAFGATKLFQAGVSEKLIQQRTGHRSVEALRQYERTSSAQLLDVSNAMSNVTNCNSHSISESCNPLPSTKEKQEQQPAIVFNGCTFTGCAVALSGPSTSYYKEIPFEEVNVSETLKGIKYGDIFDD